MARSSSISSESCARHVVEVVPAVMRLIKDGIRKGDLALSLPQMRILAFLARRPGSSLSEVSAVIDVTPATASIHIDRLVKRDLIERRENPRERRKIVLTLTQEGRRHLELATERAESVLAEMLSVESGARLSKIEDGLLLLGELVKLFDEKRARALANEVDD